MTERQTFGENLGSQATALTLIADLARQHRMLPPGYVTCSGITPNEVTVLLEHPDEFEAWREALDVAPEVVVAGALKEQAKLTFKTAVNDVFLLVWVAFPLAKSEAEGAAA